MPIFDINEKSSTYMWMLINNYINSSKELIGSKSKSESIKTRV
jgi:hypothetical protein